MNRFLSVGFICSLLLVSLAGVCVADEAPSYLGYIQGGESSITNGSDGVTAIAVKDIVPYFNLADGEKNSLISVEFLTNLTYPMSAALILSDADNETIFMVQVVNMSMLDENNGIVFEVKPLLYYEGKHLKVFNEKRKALNSLFETQHARFAMYLEIDEKVPTNLECPEGWSIFRPFKGRSYCSPF